MRHHPSETTLLRFAAGTLAAAHARVVAAHLCFCADCAPALREAEAIGGAVLTGLPPTALAPDTLARTLARLATTPGEDGAAAEEPATLAALATGRWRWTGPGIAMMPLLRRDHSDSRLDLIRVAPGVALLAHGHTGPESTCVLQGGFHDGIGDYAVGDFIEADDALAHRPTASAGEPCICLVATSGHLRPRGVLGWLVRRLIGM